MPPVPVPDSYWVVDDLLLAGEYPGEIDPDETRRKLRAFLDAGVRLFIDLVHSTTFRDGALLAVNLADDADTVGAVHGQIAGAYYGEQSIPGSWLAVLARRQEIEALAGGLLARALEDGLEVRCIES
jgi:hypothetical protein